MKESEAVKHSIVTQALNYIDINWKEKISLDDIADHLHYSKFYINRLFLEKTGVTMYKYLQLKRITEAAKQLCDTDMPIVEIAYEAGYNSQQAFTLAFHNLYLCTPQVFRKRRSFYPVPKEKSVYYSRVTKNMIFLERKLCA